MRRDPMTNLSALHQLYDGIIPKAVLDVARYGSPEMVALIRANGEVALFRSMTRAQIKTIRARPADGSYYPPLIEDLQLSRRHFPPPTPSPPPFRPPIAPT